MAGEVGDEAAGFLDEEAAGGGIPGVEVHLKEDIQAVGGYVGQIYGGRA